MGPRTVHILQNKEEIYLTEARWFKISKKDTLTHCPKSNLIIRIKNLACHSRSDCRGIVLGVLKHQT